MIDAHCYFGPGLRAVVPFGPVTTYPSVATFLQALENAGIHRALVAPPVWQGGWDGTEFVDPNYEEANRVLAEAVGEAGGRLVGLGRVNPKFGKQALRELERCLGEYGFAGLALDNELDGFHPTDLRLLAPLMDACGAHGGLLFVRTGFHPCEPLRFLPLAQAYPKIPVVLGHMGRRLARDAVIAAEHSDNIYLETAGQMPLTLRAVIRTIGPERVVFGTGTPYGIAEGEADRIRGLGLEKADMRAVTEENIKRLVGEGRWSE